MESTLTLPIPPSVNALYSGNHRRFKSKRYTAWIAEAKTAIAGIPIIKISGSVEATYRICSPDNRRRDIENYAKAVSDFISDQGFIDDDSNIQRLVMEWADDVSPGLVEVTIKTAQS